MTLKPTYSWALPCSLHHLAIASWALGCQGTMIYNRLIVIEALEPVAEARALLAADNKDAIKKLGDSKDCQGGSGTQSTVARVRLQPVLLS